MDTDRVIVHHQREIVRLPDLSDLWIMSMERVGMLVESRKESASRPMPRCGLAGLASFYGMIGMMMMMEEL
jgi:hypothetical protein